MKGKIIIFILVVAILGSIVITMQNNAGDIFFYAGTDKENYTQGELMKLSFSISTETAREVTVEIYSIMKNDGNYLRKIRDVVNLTQGNNALEYSELAPSCSRCSGISAGENEVRFIVTEGNDVLFNETKKIVIM